MLALARLRPDAYGARIQKELAEVAGRIVKIGTVYVTLVRLEKQGLVRSTRSEPQAVRGGKAKRLFELTPSGVAALRTVRQQSNRMWTGLDAT